MCVCVRVRACARVLQCSIKTRIPTIKNKNIDIKYANTKYKRNTKENP